MIATRTYGRMALAESTRHWTIERMDPHVSLRLKAMFPAVPKQAVPPFQMKRDDNTDHDLVWFMDRYPLDMSAEDRDDLLGGRARKLRRQADAEIILTPDYKPSGYVGMRDGQSLRHYQSQAIELAATSGGLLVADDCGLGKTYVGAGLCLSPERLPAAVVCQTHIQRQWVKMLKEFSTLRIHEVTAASAYALPEADIYVYRYSQLIGWADVFGTGYFNTMVLDEPQELRTGAGTGKGKAAKILSEHASFRIGLSATPIYNYGKEIFNVMGFIRPGLLGDWSDFSREYLDHNQMLRDPAALGAFLREQHAFLRRTKADVGKELPAVSRIVDVVDYDQKQVRSIDDVARALAIRATRGSFVERGQAVRDLDMMVRHATGVAKAKAVAAIVRILVESGEPILLIGWHRDVYSIWLKELANLKPGMYTGSESPKQKRDAAEDFISGKTNLLIMSLRSAAGLHGLQERCAFVVFGELDWSPGIHHQVIERLNRDGQSRPVTALFLVADEGSDPPVMEVLGLKASEAYKVTDPFAAAPANSNDPSHLRRLVDQYLEKAGIAA